MRIYQGNKTVINPQIRWLIRRDMGEVLDIEKEVAEVPWGEEEFLASMRRRNCIGMVAENDQYIKGFMIYELHKSKLRILNFAVDPDVQRKGIGTQMVERLVDKLSQQRRREITIELRETNLPAQYFFKAQDFKAVQVARGYFDDTGEDAYIMRYRIHEPAEEFVKFHPANRISEYDAV